MPRLRTKPAARVGSLSAVLLVAGLLFFVVACNAPRDNSLDPNSPNYDPTNNGEVDRPTSFFSVNISTSHNENDFAGDAQYQITTRVNLRDADGIAEVHLEVADTFRFQMQPISNSIYSHTFNPGNFGYTIFDFTGAPFYVYAYDRAGHISRSERKQIIRVLDQTPEILAPASEAVVNPQPLLVWREDTSPFPISYTVTIYRRVSTFLFEIISQQSGIPRITLQGDTIDSFTVRQPLPANTLQPYILTVTVEDEFQNRSISRGVGFFVGD